MIYNTIIYNQGGAGLTVKIVESIEEITDNNYLYLIKSSLDNSTYDEYLFIEDKPELIGNTSISLEGYVSKSDLKEMYLHNIMLEYRHNLVRTEALPTHDGACQIRFQLILDKKEPFNISHLYEEGPSGPTPLSMTQAAELERLWLGLDFQGPTSCSGFAISSGETAGQNISCVLNSVRTILGGDTGERRQIRINATPVNSTDTIFGNYVINISCGDTTDTLVTPSNYTYQTVIVTDKVTPIGSFLIST